MADDQMTLWKKEELELPIRTSPVRFAVDRGNGFSSEAWGVQVENTGDAYIYCRTGLPGQKVSLHESGKQHISFNVDDPSMKSYTGDRFMNQWSEPQYDDKAIPTLRLLFPTWGFQINSQQRDEQRAKWKKNQVLIPAHKEMVTVVSFVIVDSGRTLRKEDGSPPSAPFGVLRLRQGKSLFAIAGYEPERDLKDMVDKALQEIADMNDPKDMEGDNLTICLTGYTLENCIFMLPLLARYSPRL